MHSDFYSLRLLHTFLYFDHGMASQQADVVEPRSIIFFFICKLFLKDVCSPIFTLMGSANYLERLGFVLFPAFVFIFDDF